MSQIPDGWDQLGSAAATLMSQMLPVGLLRGTAAAELQPRNSHGPVRPAQLKEAGCPGWAFIHLLVRVHLTQESLCPKQPMGRNCPRTTQNNCQKPVICRQPYPATHQEATACTCLGSLDMAYLLKFCSCDFLHTAKDSGLPHRYLGLTTAS